MESLPQEMFEEILSYCSRGDLGNLSCCSKKYYHLTKNFYWSKVDITFCGCRRFSPHRLNNLHLTKRLHLSHGWYKEPPQPDTYMWRQCSKCTRISKEGDIDAIQKASFVSDVGLCRILGACDRNMVYSLFLNNVSTEGVHQALSILPNIWELTVDVLCCDFKCLIEMKNLTSLGVELDETNPSINEGFEHLLRLNKLSSLHIHSPINKTVLEWVSRCNHLTDLFLMQTNHTPLESLSLLKNLKSIHLQTWNTTIPVSVKPLCVLKDLRSMTLLGYSYHGKSLQYFCRELKFLHTLVLTCGDGDFLQNYPILSYTKGYVLRDDDFADIHKLASLKVLFLSGRCITLNGTCFDHISKSKSLQKIRLSIAEEGNMLPEKFCLLNTMASLRHVFVGGTEEVTRPIVDVMLNKKDWNIQMETHRCFRDNEIRQEVSWTLTL